MVQHIGYFPILYINEKTVDAQIAVGVQTYEHFFGRKPKGMWLPECGYVPEVDKLLKKHRNPICNCRNTSDFFMQILYLLMQQMYLLYHLMVLSLLQEI